MKLEGKTFAVLDGLRGIAALLVLTRHSETFWSVHLVRNYLAVDIFFLLSGFVIAHAYDTKLAEGSLSAGKFCWIRLIRLYPMYFLSLLLCFVLFFLKGVSQAGIGGQSAREATLAFICGIVFVPFKMQGSTALFPLNGPYWSLFCELCVNFIYVAIRPVLSRRTLLCIVFGSAAFMAYSSSIYGTMDVGGNRGWVWFFGGLSRAGFGMFLGVLIYQDRIALTKHLKIRGGVLLPFAFVVLVLLSPSSINGWEWLVDMLIILFIFPVCILSASFAIPTKGWMKTCLILGSVSYPMYVLHKPVAQIFYAIVPKLVVTSAPISGGLLVILLVVLSLFLERSYDIPTRAWLKSKLLFD